MCKVFFLILTFDTILLPDSGPCSAQENTDSQEGCLSMCLTLGTSLIPLGIQNRKCV